MDISDLEVLARLTDAFTSTVVLLGALIWQARRTVALSERIHTIHREHKADLRRAAGMPEPDGEDD